MILQYGMITRRRKIVLTLGALAVVVAVVVIAQPGFLTGRLAFFTKSPTNNEAVDGSYVTNNDAIALLLQGALEAGRITSETAARYQSEFSSSEDRQITREKFAELAVRIFGIENYGYGTRFSDVSSDAASAKNIYLLTSNSGASEFKPFNFTTKSFAAKTVQELSVRFRTFNSVSK